MTPAFEGKTVLKLGIFERIPTPEWEAFVGKRQEWVRHVEGATQWRIKVGGEKVEG
jgi:hypothetical protein